ncbi:DNA-binding protein [Klebsiella pneumoniae]|uniref:DNA-binding protein n=1 Tax=Klebsiella pneumoniae TaxID=573 RepID=A0A377YQ40_KLEPN|nr:DNA-binding protein [Klebsiella pneumoniae]
MAMHPSEQIAGFRTLAEQGKTPAQIGDLLGFGTRHVQRMLKLTELAPEILEALAKDEITTEHCQALALENDQARQVEVLATARKRGWNNEPSVATIRDLITNEEVSTTGKKFRFVGEDAFSPDEIRVDLFSSETGGFVKVLPSMPPCWKNCRTSRSTSAKRKAGHGVMVVLIRFLTTGRTLKSGVCSLFHRLNILRQNQNVLRSWKLWKLSMKARTPA